MLADISNITLAIKRVMSLQLNFCDYGVAFQMLRGWWGKVNTELFCICTARAMFCDEDVNTLFMHTLYIATTAL
jgi:hypothetical protein